MDLPPTFCAITLYVFFDDEVVCIGEESLPITEGGDNKFNIALLCTLSVDTGGPPVDIDATFSVVIGNYCPKLTWLNAVPMVVPPVLPLVTSLQTSSFDEDNQCGQNCDPQTCDFSVNPPICTPGPYNGLISTLFTPSGVGTIAAPNSFDTIFACDPLLPGPVELCAMVTDGDFECNKLRCITVVCPDLCKDVVCDDFDPTNDECTRDRCDPLTGTCSHDLLDGIACNSCDNTCQSGACTGAPITADQTGSQMNFVGTSQQVNMTLVNPYSGASLNVSGDFNYNIHTYVGDGTSVLFGTDQGADFLLVQDPPGTQRICGVETIFSMNQFDVMNVADYDIVFDNMVITGGNKSDIIWANAGNDTLLLENDDDFGDGGPGDDLIDCGNGNDTVTLWPGSGFDSILGGLGTNDRVEIFAIQSQILITQAASPFQYHLSYLGTPMARITGVEFIDMNDLTIDLATCVGGMNDVCNLCGNDALNGLEECDDGNNISGDGCAADCTSEP
jgi:cysteine-rich repeat protein